MSIRDVKLLQRIELLRRHFPVARQRRLWFIFATAVALLLFGLSFVQMQGLDYLLYVVVAVLIVWSGGRWPVLRYSFLAILLLQLLMLLAYRPGLEVAAQGFFVRYLLSSPAAAGWMLLFALLALLTSLLQPYQTRFARIAQKQLFVWLALCVGISGFLARWYESYLVGVEAAFIPLVSFYDVVLVLALSLLALHLLIQTFEKEGDRHQLVLIAAVIMGMLLVVLTHADAYAMLDSRPVQLEHFWLRLHVPAMVFAFAVLFAAGFVALAEVASGQRAGSPATRRLLSRLSATGFMLLSLGMVSGMLWSETAWGTIWLWETKQIASFAVWCYYAAALHMGLRHHDSHREMVGWQLFGVLLLVFVLFWSNTLPPGHHYFGQLPG